MMYLFHYTSITDKAWNVIINHKHHWEKWGGGYGPKFIWNLYNASKGTKSVIFNIIKKIKNSLLAWGSQYHEDKNWFEARQDEIEKAGGQNHQLLIMLFRTYLTLPVSEFWHFVVHKQES